MTAYYGVIGNRDYIKLRDQRRPFWEFLDRQPDGWLTSLAYRREDLPADKPMIFDCGAWSYRAENVPRLGKNLVTPEWTLARYREKAKPGDFVIAPDHMLIESFGDLRERRLFNKRSAIEFLRLARDRDTELVPMATAHGISEDEQIAHGEWLADLGYGAIAVGGLAGRASSRRRNLEVVSELRRALLGVRLHVLGLSSPSYMAEWHRLGVDSCDGSAHFKQAFTAGSFFTECRGQLTKHQAARTERGNPDVLLGEIVAPLCECRACSLLREDGVDTRTYGSNEHNMGRAAHNLNMLMRAHRWVMRDRVALVACVGKKLKCLSFARDLYQSPWFRKARVYAEQNATRWYILSAKHGLVAPGQLIEPYDKTLINMGGDYRQGWAERVRDKLDTVEPESVHLIVLAGRKYREPLLDILPERFTSEAPMEGLGIGQQLAWLNSQTIEQLDLF